MVNPNDSAFPCTYEVGMTEKFALGLSKREFFAAFALVGSAKSPQQALEAADKLIRELNK